MSSKTLGLATTSSCPALRTASDSTVRGSVRLRAEALFRFPCLRVSAISARTGSRDGTSTPRLPLANFTAVAGEVYYFRMRFPSSRQVPQLDLEQTDRDEARFLVSISSLAEAHPKK